MNQIILNNKCLEIRAEVHYKQELEALLDRLRAIKQLLPDEADKHPDEEPRKSPVLRRVVPRMDDDEDQA